MKKLLVFVFTCLGFILQAQLSVTSTTPISQTLTSSINQSIEITFSDEISPFSFGELNFQVFGRWSGPMTGNYDFSEDFHTIIFIPEGEFIAGEMVTVNLSTNISTPNSQNLNHGHAFSFWIKTEPALLNLSLIQEIEMRVEGEEFIQCYGAYAGDLNNDGFSDLAVVNEYANDIRVLLNDGDGGYDNFVIYEMPLGYKPSPSEGADFNHDGEIDIAVSHVQSNIVSVMMGDGDGAFSPEVGYEVGQGVRGLAVMDLEADGHMDIVTANRDDSNISLLTNDGFGIFNTINTIPGVSDGETAIAIADANEDGIMDLFVGAYSGSEISVLINDGFGNFSLGSTTSVSGQSWMITIGDVNNDGHVDVVSANSTGNNCSVHFGDGEGGFLESFTYSTGNFPLAIDLGDLDGDGDLDMITSNYSGADYTLFENDGNGLFINPISYPATNAGSCAIFHDRNNDGTMDLTLIDELADLVFLYENDVTGISDYESSKPVIYPNPFSNKISLRFDETLHSSMVIINLLGKTIATLRPTAKNGQTYYHWTPQNSIAKGLYFARIGDTGVFKILYQ